ncbi:MAG: acyltransferase [Planctomycetes bacterium]|nr:acyltransferase [Planctomycetota bacterium]
MGILRLLLALAVVFAHAGPLFGVRALAMTGGPLAVQMFYVVSGFYMALVLNEKYRGPGSYKAFAESRLVRLFPMYLAVVALTLAVGLTLHFGGHTIPPLRCWIEHGRAMPWPDALGLGLVQFTIVGQDAVVFAAVDPATSELFATADFHTEALPAWRFMLVPQAWTIGLELMFYAVAPLLVRRRAAVIGLVVLASLALRVALVRRLGLGNDPWTYRFFPTELALFLAGALSYRLYRALGRRGWLRPLATWGVTVATIGAVAVYPLLPAALHWSPYGLAVGLLALPFALPFAFELTARSRLDRAVGELSYPVYLVHYLLCFLLPVVGMRPWSIWSGLAVAPLAVLSAWMLWRFVGVPIEGWRQRIGARLRARTEVSGSTDTADAALSLGYAARRRSGNDRGEGDPIDP